MKKLLLSLCLLAAVAAGQATNNLTRQYPPAGATEGYRASSGSGAGSLPTGLYEYWKFEEASGQRAGSIFGLVWNQPGGAVAGVAGKSGNGASISSGSWLQAQAADFLDAGNSFTVSFWMFPTAYQETSGAGSPILINVSGTGSGFDLIKVQASTNIRYTVYAGGGNVSKGGNPLPTGAWHHVILTCTPNPPSSICNFRVDGGSFSTVQTGFSSPSGTLDVMQFSYTNGLDGVTAIFDEVGVWRRVLTVPEMDYLYNGGTGRFYPFS